MPGSRMRFILLMSIGILIGILAVAHTARAGDFYKGKNFTIVVGFSPGGGFDTYARNVARYIGKYIPAIRTLSCKTCREPAA